MIVFRTDGNSTIGSGHIMRCLSLADKFAETSSDCVFVVADNSFTQIISDRGYRFIVLDSNYTKMDEEIEKLLPIFETNEIEKYIVDSYFVTYNYFESIKNKYCFEILYIDDLMSEPFPVDTLLNYNIYAEKELYISLYGKQNIKLPKLLIGTKYVPLRKQFLNIKPILINENVKSIFVSTGGADKEHILLKMIEYIVRNNDKLDCFTFNFVVGSANLDIELILKAASGAKNVIIHKNVLDMANLMCECDMAISAAGSTLYELCSCGVPTITYVLADNQMFAAEKFNEKEIMNYIGDYRVENDFFDKLFNRLFDVSSNFGLRLKYSRNMLSIMNN